MQGRGANPGVSLPGRPIAGPSTGGIPSISRLGSHPQQTPVAGGQRPAGVTALGHDVLQGQASKRRKPAIDRHLPLFYPEEHSSTRESDQVLQGLRESYTSLEALEKKLDWTLSRKKAEYSELIGKSGTHTGQPKGKLGGVRRNLRLLIRHEISGGSQAGSSSSEDKQAAEKGETEQQSEKQEGEARSPKAHEGESEDKAPEHKTSTKWTLKVAGLLQTEGDEEKTHFSSLVNSVLVEVMPDDPSDLMPAERVEWHPPANSAPVDGLTLSRERPAGDGEDQQLKLRISLHLDQHPERYKLIEPISRFLDIQEESKAGCLLALWAYIKKNELQENDNRQMIKCDPFLAMFAGKQPGQQIYFFHLGDFLVRWLQRPDPVMVDYTINLARSSTAPEAYDISITVADPAASAIEKFLGLLAGPNSTITGIVQSDLNLAQACSKAKAAKNKRDVCAAFSTDPIQFIFDYLESQSIDLDNFLNQNAERGAMASLGGPTPNLEEVRRSGFWQGAEWSDEAVRLYSQRQLATKAMGMAQNGGLQYSRR